VQGLVDAPWRVIDGTGSVTFPITTPGDLRRLRFGGWYTARSPGDGWALQVSFDGGATLQTVAQSPGVTTGDGLFTSFDQIPPGARSALVRYAGTRVDTSNLTDFRIDADYAEPGGGFRPVRIVYTWSENGVELRDEHIARSPSETYTIHCNAPPRMESIALSLAPLSD
jgi:hypothetical protein